GSSRTYRYYIPNDKALEGAHYMHPGPGFRDQVSHGLFGVLVVEPPGSTYLNPINNAPLASGWEATIIPAGAASFREHALLFHEIGNENFRVLTSTGAAEPLVDPHTTAYRPDTRAINYRSESFMKRLDRNPAMESQGYGSYAFGDPPTPTPRNYQGEPTKIRLVHAGTEMFHVFHLHGGGIRWRFNPAADSTYNYADTGLNKHPVEQSASSRLDSQAMGPGESYNLEIEGGAGGVQQVAGDFLFHCHIAEHYVGGMWAFWRVFDTTQPDLMPLPDRTPPPTGIDSSGLIGKTIAQTLPDGTVNNVTITPANLDDWIRAQLPPAGVQRSDQDASVWNWTIDPGTGIYLGETEDPGPWPDLPNVIPGHPGSMLGDQLIGNRPKIMFDPRNGRVAYPLLRPHIGKRPPFSPNGHSGAPWLGETGNAALNPKPGASVDPFAGRADGLCPKDSPVRRFNVVAVERPIQVTQAGGTDALGKIFVLAQDKAAVLAGTKPAQPLALRSNIGDCDAVTLTSELTDANAADLFSKVNMHIHHVQFDTQASDGVISGMQYEQSVRPYKVEDPQLTVAAAAGSSTVTLSSVAKFQPGVWIGVDLGSDGDAAHAGPEIRQIASINAAASTVTLTVPLGRDHALGEWAGTEYVQYRWYPDVALDNIFWHDHVDGIHTWGHGLVGQLIIEPRGSTYHDPVSGDPVDSGTIVDIRTPNALAPGLVDGSFRELALWTLDENPVTDSTLNLRAVPWADRLTANGDPSLLFSSYTHGDPNTPLPRAYPNDPFVIRTINVGPSVDTLHVDGHSVYLENRYLNPAGTVEASPINTIHYGISEKFSLMLQGGAGGPRGKPGDYLYFNGIGRRFRQGAWGIIRVLPGAVPNLQPLPGRPAPAAPAVLPTQTGGRPPEPAGPGDPCPVGAPTRSFNISAVDRGGVVGTRAVFVRTVDAAAVQAGTLTPEPLVLHAAAGECLTVNFTNQRVGARASFHLDGLERDPESSGVNAGFTPEQTVAPGLTRAYRFYAGNAHLDSVLLSDAGGTPVVPDPVLGIPINVDTGPLGMYGSVNVAPIGATFTDPVSGAPKDVGAQVDVHVPRTTGYRDFTVFLADQDQKIGASQMPYPTAAQTPGALLNYRATPRADNENAFSSLVNGDPTTPILRSYTGDPMRVHALVAPGSEQMHVFGLGGMSWPIDPQISRALSVEQVGVGPWEKLDAQVVGGAGGRGHAAGDYFYGDMRRPFQQVGMWGLQRVMSDPTCPIRPLDGLTCTGGPPPIPNAPKLDPATDSGASATDGVTNVASPTVVGSAQSGSIVNVYVDGTLKGSSTAAGDGTFSIAVGPLAQGAHSVTVAAADAAANESLPSDPFAVTIDTIAPVVPSVPDLTAADDTGASNSDNVTKDPTPILVGSAETGATVRLHSGGVVIGTGTAGAGNTYSVKTNLLADGVYPISASATDLAGNASAVSSTLSVTIDTIAPATPIAPDLDAASDTGASNSDNVTRQTAPVFTGLAEASSTIDLLVNGATDGSAPVGPDGRYSITAVTLGDGTHAIAVDAKDLAGNSSTVSPTLNITIDTVAPGTPAVPALDAASDSGASSSDGITNDSTPTFTGNAEPNAAMKVFDGTALKGTASADGAGSYSVTSSLLADGVHSMSTSASDLAGNESARSGPRSVTIDTVAVAGVPDLAAASDSGSSSSDDLTNDSTPTIVGTAEPSAAVTLYADGIVRGSGTAGAGDGSYAITNAALVDGLHSISISIVDLAGNVSLRSIALGITIDTLAPGAPSVPDMLPGSDSGASNSDNVTNDPTPTVNGNAESGAAVKLLAGGLLRGSGPATAGSYSITLSPLAEGTHALSASATDLAGNESAFSGSLSLTIDL
ncbi:MAG: Ig-like domain-containing protein, partial [Actinomycetota bacterium]|nr:Ig-like domain-containing protein [Actinomycetota bacterium]